MFFLATYLGVVFTVLFRVARANRRKFEKSVILQIIAERALTNRFEFRIRILKGEEISGTRTVGH